MATADTKRGTLRYPRIHGAGLAAETRANAGSRAPELPGLDALGDAFCQATGWRMEDVGASGPTALRRSGAPHAGGGACDPCQWRGPLQSRPRPAGNSGSAVSRRKAHDLAVQIGRLTDQLRRGQAGSRDRQTESPSTGGMAPVESPSRTRGHCRTIVPLVDGWEIVAGNEDGGREGNADLYDWFVHGDGLLSLSLARAYDCGLQGLLTIATMGGAIRALRDVRDDPGTLVERINRSLWTGSAGDQWSSLIHARVQPDTGATDIAMAGAVSAFILRDSGLQPITQDEVALGVEPSTAYGSAPQQIEPGEALVLSASRSTLDPYEPAVSWPVSSGPADLFARSKRLSASRILSIARQQSLRRSGADGQAAAILVAKRFR